MRTRSLRTYRYSRRAGRQAHRPLMEPLETRALLATITVDSTDDTDTNGAVLTLREAIEVANGTLAVGSLTAQQQAQVSGTVATGAPGNTIAFDIPGSGVQTIALTSTLPTITVPVTIDGYTQPGSSPNTLADGDNAVPLIELARGNQGINGLTITAGDSTVQGLVIDGNVSIGSAAIEITTEGDDLIDGNFLGPDPAGTANAGTVGFGVQIMDAPDNTIGGTTPAARNLLSVTGGITGGTFSVQIEGAGASGNLVQGNFIGTNAAGTAILDGGGGIDILDAPNNTIGGTTAGARNVIGFDETGTSDVEIENLGTTTATGNLVQGNYIGIGVTGTASLGFQPGAGTYGVLVVDASQNTIGGTAAGAGNVISGLGSNNGSVGVVVSTASGTTSNNLVEGNFIGTDASGMTAVPNDVGIEIFGGATGTTIGGTTAGAGNIISGNSGGPSVGGVGISFAPGVAPGQNVVQGNSIGVNATGAPLGNSGIGVQLAGGNTVGGTAAGAGNVIANNGGAGVVVEGAAGDPTSIDNAILSNDIFANGRLGIDLGGSGVVIPNHPDGTGAGPNNLENYPVITAVTSSGGSTTITGTLNSTPDESFLIQFFNNDAPDPSSFGQGQTYIGSIQTGLTDATTGNVSFTATLPVAVSPTQFVTATATDADGDTSEFSEIDADLAVSQVASAPSVAVGQDVTFTGTVTNAGPFAAPGLVLSDALPAGFSFVSATGGATPQNGALSIPLSTLPVGSSTTVTVVLQATTAGGPFTNTMSVTSAVIDPDTTNNTSTATASVTPPAMADVSVQIAAMPDPVAIGQDLTYTVTATNTGPSPATGVMLTDTLPAGVTFVSATDGASPSNGVLSFALGSLDVGDSSTVTVVVRPTAAGAISDDGAVSADQTDPDPDNNTATVSTTVNAPATADLSVELAGTPDPVDVGQDLTYTITVANAGPSPATDVVVTDTLPAGVTFVSATGGATPSDGTLSFALGFLDLDDSTTFTVDVRPTAAGTISDSAAVSANESDPDPGNNTAMVSTTVNAPATASSDLSVGLAETPGPVEVGQDLTYTITVANAGPSSATGVVLTDTLPAGVTFVAATGGATPTGGALTFSIGALATGADTSVTITITPTTAAGTLTDVAAVHLDQSDPDPADNTRTLSTTVASPAMTPVPTSTTSPSAIPAAPTATPTASPTPTPSSPTVLSVHRFGFHSHPTKFVLSFNRPLDPARAGDPANYQLVNISDPIRPIRFRSATYNPADQSVTLRPMHRLYLYDRYRLTVANLRSMAVTVAAVDPVDGGTTGGDFVTIITPANLVLTPAQRRDGPLMAMIRSLAITFPGLAHLVDGPASRPGT